MHPILPDPLQHRNLPRKILDDLHPSEQLLQHLRPFIRPPHRLDPNLDQILHNPTLKRRNDHENRETSQRARSQIDNQLHEANGHLNRCSPEHVEETTAEVDAGDVGGDMVDETTVGEGGAGAGG